MKTRNSLSPIRGDRGFTVVELMIAMTIGLVLLAVVSSVMLGAMGTSSARERDSDIHVNGRYAVETVRRSLNHAGFLGVTSLFEPNAPYITTAVTNVCDVNNIARISQRVWASNDSNPFSGTCIPAANYLAGTDVLVVRHLSTNPVAGPYTTAAPVAANFNAPYTAFDANTLYYHSAYEGGTVFRGNEATVPPNFTVSSKQPPYFDYLVEEYAYYISPYTNSATESPLVPALYRMRLVGGAAAPEMQAELVASGVEDLQVRLGQIGISNSGAYLSPATVTDWDAVQAVEVSMLVRSATRDPKLTATQSYNVSGNTVSRSDGIPRRVYSMVVQMRN